jgi:hypothetical protein
MVNQHRHIMCMREREKECVCVCITILPIDQVPLSTTDLTITYIFKQFC